MNDEYPSPSHKPPPPKWLSYLFLGLTIPVGMAFIITAPSIQQNPELSVGLMCLMFSMLACKFFIDASIKERRCTKRTVGHATEVVRRWRSRRVTYCPIVTFTVYDQTDDRYSCDYTVKLPVKCHKHAEGELYTVFYDPDEPTVVRAEGETKARTCLIIAVISGMVGIILAVAGLFL